MTTDAATAGRGRAEEVIRTRILDAILERRLPPGEKLTEERLAQLFGVSRTIVRQALARLAQDGIVEQHANRGTFVAAPTREGARHVLEARCIVEPEIAALVAGRCACQAGILRAHLAREDRARAAGDRATLVRLTGEFHVRLAELAGNTVFQRLLTELQALSSLAILLYARGGHESCPPEDHANIVAAIEQGDAGEAARLMHAHLGHVAADLDLAEPPDRPTDLADALGIGTTAEGEGTGARRGAASRRTDADSSRAMPTGASRREIAPGR
ncbi:GntR family transcriptional regulator [Ancylobacter sp. 6x-1]|uniref:GntR family transcriptional regulator n=1 Tax=Ancylobacter crimeensis TaxID=2579147 RepID=A0ABT0DC67_9HYPH|nr:GntR family transcriptional regulator [Ancylobacter crimeensis]MCK0197342.1 GntR family transcriptional regulator [Ancylobacter crimeensis]